MSFFNSNNIVKLALSLIFLCIALDWVVSILVQIIAQMWPLLVIAGIITAFYYVKKVVSGKGLLR